MVQPEIAPAGTIALLFTDIEGSTTLARRLGAGWAEVLAQHHEILAEAIGAHGGWIDGTEGDAFFATFADPAAGGAAAIEGQRRLRRAAWPDELGELKVRMGLHVGFVERTDTGYVGLEVHRAARVAGAAHGGQLLLTAAAAALLAEQVATDPLGSHRLKDFPAPEPLFCAVIDGRGAGAFPPPRTEELRSTNLPAGTPVLVGREDDIERVRAALLADHERIVTLTGRGGTGKTSVALAVAASLLDDFPGGVWLARLANVAAPDGLLPAIASAVGAASQLGIEPGQAIVNRLSWRGAVLLVIDNMEQLTGAAPALAALTEALPELQLLVTSQSPLHLAEELCLPLDALDDDAAVALLERTAHRRSPGFRVHDRHRDALVEVVRLLDGLPLALELAGARLALLTPVQLAERLGQSAALLRDDRPDRPERHRSLQATVDWTLELLAPPERELFTRLGAFAAPVELEEIEAVAGGDGLDVLDALARLLEVALVRRIETGDGRIRFGLPEALRQIAAARLDQDVAGERWRRAHAARQAEILAAAETLIVTTSAFDAALAAGPEITTALAWARSREDPLALPLAAGWGALAADVGRTLEATALLDWVFERAPADSLSRCQAFWASCWVQAQLGRSAEAVASGERAVALATEPGHRVIALLMLALAHTHENHHALALELNAEASVVARELGDGALLCGALLLESQALLYGGDSAAAAVLLEESERVGEASDSTFAWRCNTVRGDLCVLEGRLEDALSFFARSLEEAERRGHDGQALFDTLGMAVALAGLGRDEAATEIAAMAEALVSELGGAEASGTHLLSLEPLGQARERLGSAGAADAEARGRAVPPARRISRTCELGRAPVPA